MPDTFEPFQRVLVRSFEDQKWKIDFYSHYRSENWPHQCAGDVFKFCIPYTPETAHLLGTTQPYEQPKPPQEYEWGQKVEVLSNGTDWERGIWIKIADNTECPQQHFVALEYGVFIWCKENEIRPLPDSAAQ